MEQNVPQLRDVEMASNSTGDSNSRTVVVMKTDYKGPHKRDTLSKGSKLLIKKVHWATLFGLATLSTIPLAFCTFVCPYIFDSSHSLRRNPILCFSYYHVLASSSYVRSLCHCVIQFFIGCKLYNLQRRFQIWQLRTDAKECIFRVVGNRTMKKNGKLILKQYGDR